ncbi:sigma-54 dependent transcriptional regulator [Caballeronia sp. LZ029]|uniref:sigma-54 dependent transcriptional regulator n=1 Tax=Caballeronia sp. LZ029 TaxID=3038564 RepID=UPI0028588687|nr:sigma-54 dependent transcriptional regulator [Caballeronia sp. LZ029]MDR5748852.1 sigma-54 dependent transcriptional regulator [Caballeronia sp. LZ029]
MESFDEKTSPFGCLVGEAPSFVAVLKQIGRFARFDVPLVIEGETGTGKELAARAIHYGGNRRSKPFVPVNCGAIPESLIENELFGHARGAYTDARVAGSGLLRLAHLGTLFLDEIDSLPLRGQIGLLRFLQDGRYRPLGASEEQTADVRIIAASNRKLEMLVAEHAFRADLLFRLRVLTLEMPPLRARPGDPLLLAHHFIEHFSHRYDTAGTSAISSLSSTARDWVQSYAWPGNVRELENLIHRAYVLAEGREICIPHQDMVAIHRQSSPAQAQSTVDIQPAGYSSARMRALECFDRAYLDDLMRRAQGNVSLAARLAGKERRALGKLLKKHQIDCAQFRNT